MRSTRNLESLIKRKEANTIAKKFRGRGPRRNFQRKVENPHKINEEILAPKVRLIVEGEGQDVLSPQEALVKAKEAGLDLVEIAPNADPPVVKIIDYKKFLYEQKKKQKEIKSKASKVVVKEIRFGPHTDEHDFNFKLNHAQKFLEDGAKLKAYVFFRGRTIVYKEQGEILLLKLAQALEDVGVVESMPKLEGKRMIIMIAPKKK